ncbi:MAG: hypothetical protein A2934_05825 [Candidatus Sungbacteria bacterium RIFCSPLOWO2_01_FULL_47_10]|uniref:Uncharacterized protein n=1 Tax=Candidatus Sungbacteria bacterium RIFCSPLOWO2_01_FULL_47_10 TaxID=1802276 RepID=A0A1G2L7P7_9BACT|nr:MAG: hypothetical protein A2934_05825 [Candidatus Sungbacteria bacterium RIFCSPLOWO2_01_FULL_47_10]
MARLLAIGLFLIVTLSACGNLSSSDPSTAGPIVVPVDYGSGVLYFNAAESTFGKSLAYYQKHNPGLEIICLSSDNTGVYGTTSGYWVIIKSR